MDNFQMKKISSTLLISLIVCFLTSCSNEKWFNTDTRKISTNVDERVKKNLEEGKGWSLAGMGDGDQSTGYQFASSNPMWRATLEILDFLPLSNVDYSGGIITTDWYDEGTSSDESVKITIRFLTNEVRADGIKVIVHKKKCTTQQKCKVQKVTSALENELRVAILKKAAILEKEFLSGRKLRKRPEVK